MQVVAGESKVMLVAVECGGEWQFGIRPDADTDLMMVVQVAGEDPLVFARRFLEKVVRVIGRGADVVSAALAVAPTFDVRHLKARRAIARALLRAFRCGSQSEFYLLEPRNSTLDCRVHLTAIAEDLMANAPADCRILVGFGSIGSSDDRAARTGT